MEKNIKDIVKADLANAGEGFEKGKKNKVEKG